MQLNSRKIYDPIKKWAKELNKHFSKKDIQSVTCSTLKPHSKTQHTFALPLKKAEGN